MVDVMLNAQDEMNSVWDVDFPECNDWKDVDIQGIVRQHIAKISARAFIGKAGSTNDKWIKTSIDFSMDLWVVSLTLRQFPPWTHPFILPFLPSRYRITRQYKDAHEALLPEINRYKDAKARGIQEKEIFSLLHGMIDDAKGDEQNSKDIVALQLITSLAGIHTSAMLTSYLLFELCRHPEYVQPLVEEAEATKAKGPDWVKTSHKEMMLMDSFICEVIRWNPPVMLLPQRRAMVPFTLADGSQVPSGTHCAWPMTSINEDPDLIDDPAKFDPFRNYKKRQEMGENAGAEKLATTAAPEHLTFGYGVQQCPGRFFAINEIKMIMNRLLTEYEFKMTDKMLKKRMHVGVEEYLVPNPLMRIMIRKKPNV